eukprot:480887-Amphidinium_carterae.1
MRFGELAQRILGIAGVGAETRKTEFRNLGRGRVLTDTRSTASILVRAQEPNYSGMTSSQRLKSQNHLIRGVSPNREREAEREFPPKSRLQGSRACGSEVGWLRGSRNPRIVAALATSRICCSSKVVFVVAFVDSSSIVSVCSDAGLQSFRYHQEQLVRRLPALQQHPWAP